MTQNGFVHPQFAETMQQLQQFQNKLEDMMQQINTGKFKGTDHDSTVEVTVNAQSWLTNLHIEDGLLRLGAATVQQRINDAILAARGAALAGLQEQQSQYFADLAGITHAMKKGVAKD